MSGVLGATMRRLIMSEQYTPTTEEVRDRYADARAGIGEWTRFDDSVARAVEEAYAEFDRWLAERDAEVAAKAWDRGCASGYREAHTNVTERNPYRKAVEK